MRGSERNPFAVSVDGATKGSLDCNAQKAEQEFLDKPQGFRVRAEIDLTPTYSAVIPSGPGTARSRSVDFWWDFQIKVLQDHKIPARSVHGWPLYSHTGIDTNGLLGAEVELEYDTTKIDSDSATVKVLTPNGQIIETAFDLAKLRQLSLLFPSLARRFPGRHTVFSYLRRFRQNHASEVSLY